ncbi:MAG TPA: porin family protein [Saprospiraceae bacterium]|nr:porin family protein [Saprospiraceae bacterium]
MKPIYYFAILMFTSLVANPAFSQSQTTIGVTAGINLPNVEFESVDNESKEQYIGYYGGLHAQFPIKGDFSLVSNLIYSRKGWHNDPFPATGYPGADFHLDYLDLQLSGQYAITKSLAVNAGVEVGQLLKTTNTNDPDNTFFDDLYQKSDFSLLMGVNYKIWKGFSLDARYLLGLSYLYKGNATDINGNDLGEVKEGTFGVFQFGISADLFKVKGADKQKV